MGADDRLIYFPMDIFEEALTSAIGAAEKATRAAIYSTMGKTRKHATTALSALIRQKWAIKKQDLDKKIPVRIIKGGQGYESFELVIKGTAISLPYFGAKQYMGNKVISRTVGKVNKRRSKFQGVEVEVLKGRKTSLPGAFMQAAGSGHMMVMKRKGKSRYPVALKASISPASMFDGSAQNYFEEDITDFIERTFEHELAWRLKQAGLD